MLSKMNTKPLLLPEEKKLNSSKLLDLWSDLDLELLIQQALEEEMTISLNTKTLLTVLKITLVLEVTLMTEDMIGNLLNDQSISGLDKRTL
jgi:hypothetical protein